MRALILIALAGMVASCSHPAIPEKTAADVLAGRVAGPPQSCVTSNQAQNIHALDSQTLAYGYGKTIYVNHLKGPCPAIAPLNTLIVVAGSGNEYCRGDRVRGLEQGAIIAGPSCNLEDWVPYRQQ